MNVSAFTDQFGTFNNVPIVTAVMAYDNPATAVTTILIIGQAIYMEDTMPNTLLCPNQLRSNGLIVEECPKHLAPREKPSLHAIVCHQEDLIIPLNLQGVTSYFVTRTPTINEDLQMGVFIQQTPLGPSFYSFSTSRRES